MVIIQASSEHGECLSVVWKTSSEYPVTFSDLYFSLFFYKLCSRRNLVDWEYFCNVNFQFCFRTEVEIKASDHIH